MRVPLSMCVSGGGNKTASRLAKPPRQEHALSHPSATVGGGRLLGFLGDIESLFYVRRKDHPEGLFLERVHPGELGGVFFLAVVLIDDLEHRAPVVNSLRRNRFGQAEVGHDEI